MGIFVDSSVWVRWLDQDDPSSLDIRRCLFGYKQSQVAVLVSAQVLREIWSVLSRPRSANGLGLRPAEANTELAACPAVGTLLHENDDQFGQWRELVVRYGVSGRQVHDANHIAFMLSHGIKHVLTLDRRDFERYSGEGVVVIGPEDTL